jgi:hypothetical protein
MKNFKCYAYTFEVAHHKAGMIDVVRPLTTPEIDSNPGTESSNEYFILPTGGK